MRVAVIFRPRSAAPVEATPMLMGALGQWVDANQQRFATLEFFVAGGGLAVGDFDDSGELLRLVAENPFSPYSDVSILPVVAPGEAMETYVQMVATLAAAAPTVG